MINLDNFEFDFNSDYTTNQSVKDPNPTLNSLTQIKKIVKVCYICGIRPDLREPIIEKEYKNVVLQFHEYCFNYIVR